MRADYSKKPIVVRSAAGKAAILPIIKAIRHEIAMKGVATRRKNRAAKLKAAAR